MKTRSAGVEAQAWVLRELHAREPMVAVHRGQAVAALHARGFVSSTRREDRLWETRLTADGREIAATLAGRRPSPLDAILLAGAETARRWRAEGR